MKRARCQSCFLISCIFFSRLFFSTNVHLCVMFRKDLVIEPGINPLSSLLHSLVYVFPSFFIFFRSFFFFSFFSFSRSLFRSRIVRSSSSKPPALPCRFGSPRHRCNVSCRARARTSEKPVSKPGITPMRSTQPRYVGDSLSLSLPAFRNIGGGGGGEGQRDEEGRETTSSSSLASLP